MRRLTFDQYEFDTSSSEESLEIQVASKSTDQVRDLVEFVLMTEGPGSTADLSDATNFTNYASCSPIREYLERFAGIIVPKPCDWQTYVLYEDDLEWDGVFDTPECFIRYYW